MNKKIWDLYAPIYERAMRADKRTYQLMYERIPQVIQGNAMIYTTHYFSPLGPMTIACDESAIIGLWFDGQQYYGSILPQETVRVETMQEAPPLLRQAQEWLDVYFSGQEPDFLPPLRYGNTPFRRRVSNILLTIPYGQTMTYGAIAAEIMQQTGTARMSAQAVGGAVGHNPIAIMIPCHRVIGTDGSLTGYAGGIERKVQLLELEHVDMRG